MCPVQLSNLTQPIKMYSDPPLGGAVGKQVYAPTNKTRKPRMLGT